MEPEEKNNMKDFILGYIDDLVGRLLYYDRKGDEELKEGDIEGAVKKGVVTIDEMADRFKSELFNKIK